MKADNPNENDWRALLYALSLRNAEPRLSTDEIFFYVGERYPHTAKRLEAFLIEREFEQRSGTKARSASAAG